MLTNHSEKTEDGKSYVNPQTGVLSEAYEKFVDPIDNGTRGGKCAYESRSLGGI